MSTVRILTFSDVHISAHNPSARLGSYKDDIFDKLNQIRLVGTKINADLFLMAGDLFTHKAPMRNPHILNTELIDLFKSYPAEIYSIEGNHDLRNDNYETFKEQPLSVIYASGALRQLTTLKTEIRGIRLHVEGCRFREEPDLDELPHADESVDLSICVLHLYASEAGGRMYRRKVYSYAELATLGYDVYVLGHYHIYQGIHEHAYANKTQTFINLGAISRGTHDDDNVNRIPRIGHITVSRKEDKVIHACQSIRLKVRPAEEVFDLEKKEEDKKKLEEAERFVEKLKDELHDADTQAEAMQELNQLDLERSVLDKAMYYIREAELQRKELES